MKKSLGRGLQSLIPPKRTRLSSLTADLPASRNKKESVFNVEIDKIKPNSRQPRQIIAETALQEMADSIKEYGILQPLIVSKIEKPTKRGRQVEYELVAGERRWRAARLAGLPHVPVIIRDSSDDQRLELALVENVQREDLNALEEAQAYYQLYKEFNLKHEEIAKKVGKKRTTISNSLRLLNLPNKIQQALLQDKISEGHARAILMAKSQARISLYQKIIKNNLSVREAEDKARKVAEINRKYSHGPKNPIFIKMEKELTDYLGHRVSIIQRRGINYLNINFANQKELSRLFKRLLKT